MEKLRRDLIKKAVVAYASVSLGGILPSFGAKSYASNIGVNERIKVGVMSDLSFTETF